MNLIDNYIQQYDEKTQSKLNELRNFIKQLVPEATEKISYQMPTYDLNGNLVHFAAQKNHIGFYPGGEVIELFKDRLHDYHVSKGTIQLPYHKDIPWAILKDIILYRRIEQLKKTKK